MNETVDYCGPKYGEFHDSYAVYHGYISLVVCIFGCIANSLNIVVLTRREMRSPTNAILTGLAIADLLVMIDYIPYSLIAYVLPHTREQFLTYRNAFIILTHSIFSQTCHTISIWLTVLLAVWRYIAVGHPQRNRLWCQMHTTLIAIASAYVICPFITIPIYLSTSIQSSVELLGSDGNKLPANFTNIEVHNATLYRVGYSDLVEANPTFLIVNFWIYSVIIKLLPCIALTILSLRLISALLEAKRRRKNLITNSNAMKVIVNGKVEKKKKNSKLLDKEKQTDRTTKMLLAVLLLFLITEVPQGILGFLNAVLKKSFFRECYAKFGDVMDDLALVNSAINFILYCSMSRQFRSTFNLLFRPKFVDRWLLVPQDVDDENDIGRTYAGGKDINGPTTHVTQISQV